MNKRFAVLAPVALGLILVGQSAALAQTTPSNALKEVPADKAKITGSMVIDYNSRSARSQSNVDLYEITGLTVADLLVLNGTIQRVPERQLTYSMRFDVINPANTSQVQKDAAILRGDLVIDSTGRYGTEAGNLRLDVVKGNQTTAKFSGGIQGRAVARWWDVAKKLKQAAKEATKAYSRYVDGKVITIQLKNPDPLRFDRLGLAAGPFSFLVGTTVSGTLDYDYELGNWLTDQSGVTFTYTLGDKVYSDKVTGSIRYVEEPGSFTDAKNKKHPYTSYYDYNLRFNEPPVNKDAGFFGGDTTQSDTDAFFSSSDTTKPGLYGRVYYNDSETGCKTAKDEAGATKCVGPTRSEVTWDLKGVGLTYIQMTNWVKLEQLVMGPFTDE
jgi:hypothetical protein